jgi:hypothetical protein
MSFPDLATPPSKKELQLDGSLPLVPPNWLLPVDAEWDQRVYKGLLWGLIWMLVVSAALTLHWGILPAWVSRLITLVMAVPAVVFFWMWTEPHPARPDWARTTRWLARAGYIVGLLQGPLILLASLAVPKPVPDWAVMTYGAISTAIMATFLFQLAYGRQFAQRIGNPGVSTYFKVVFWIGAVILALSALMLVRPLPEQMEKWRNAFHPAPPPRGALVYIPVLLIITAAMVVPPTVCMLVNLKRRMNASSSTEQTLATE